MSPIPTECPVGDLVALLLLLNENGLLVVATAEGSDNFFFFSAFFSAFLLASRASKLNSLLALIPAVAGRAATVKLLLLLSLPMLLDGLFFIDAANALSTAAFIFSLSRSALKSVVELLLAAVSLGFLTMPFIATAVLHTIHVLEKIHYYFMWT